MKLRQLLTEEDAVSPVIGVILMVAITVILAAVIGTFVLGLGQNVDDSAPQANFQFEYDDGGDGSYTDSDNSVTATHTGGQDVDAANVVVQVGGTEVTGSWSSTTISTGSEYSYTGAEVTAGSSVRIIWSSPSGGSSQTIGQSEVPS